ncbi:hypothetical protein [Serratia marcescens]|uniref:hypothetical protein n=1 Tax=Serratia marcescens TaxID=615 RepID=UPI00066DC778|nr:hypothetical protein [Serratia marcescens]
MDNKLSELSKPVMYSLRFRNMHTGETDKKINANTTFSTLEKARSYGLGTRYVTQDDGKIVNVRDPSQDPIVEPLYSQEYVSALKQRIAELEQVPTIKHMRSVEESLIRATDMVSELEKRLATPVRLPEAHSTLFRQHIRSDYQSLQAFKADEVIAALRAAGFTVEGDE